MPCQGQSGLYEARDPASVHQFHPFTLRELQQYRSRFNSSDWKEPNSQGDLMLSQRTDVGGSQPAEFPVELKSSSGLSGYSHALTHTHK